MALYINNLTHNSHSPVVDAPDVAHVSRRAVSAFLPTCLRPSRCTPKKTTKRIQARTPEAPCRHSGLHVFAPTSRNYQTNLRFTPPPGSAPLDIDVDPRLHPKQAPENYQPNLSSRRQTRYISNYINNLARRVGLDDTCGFLQAQPGPSAGRGPLASAHPG